MNNEETTSSNEETTTKQSATDSETTEPVAELLSTQTPETSSAENSGSVELNAAESAASGNSDPSLGSELQRAFFDVEAGVESPETKAAIGLKLEDEEKVRNLLIEQISKVIDSIIG